jgi:hypothetical protein
MGMSYEEEAAEKMRKELKERLRRQQQEDEYEGLKGREEEKSSNPSFISSLKNVLSTADRKLGFFIQALTNHEPQYDDVWKMVKTVLFTYLFAALFMVLLPSWVSPLYYGGSWLFYAVLILLVISSISTFSSWLILKENKRNEFFKTSSLTFKVFAGVWIVLFLILLFSYSVSANYTMGVFFCIICVAFAYYKSYKISRYVRSHNLARYY